MAGFLSFWLDVCVVVAGSRMIEFHLCWHRISMPTLQSRTRDLRSAILLTMDKLAAILYLDFATSKARKNGKQAMIRLEKAEVASEPKA